MNALKYYVDRKHVCAMRKYLKRSLKLFFSGSFEMQVVWITEDTFKI